MDIFSALRLLLGLSFFLFGMQVMSGNLERIAGGRLEQILGKMTARPISGLALGIGVTAAVQSSSAVTVMLVGLANAGIMTLRQTVYVIFGANIGTTLTAWLLSLTGLESGNFWIRMLKPENFAPLFALAGVVLLMLRRADRSIGIGSALLGFALLMHGMELMKEAVAPLADRPEFSDLMVRFENPLLGVLAGTVITALIQSSSASVGILQALSLTGSVTGSTAIPLVMGQNIGTCVTALLSCIGAGSTAKRVAMVHLLINVVGTAICLALYTAGDLIFTFPDRTVGPAGIALIHTLFNVAITVMLLPFSGRILRLAEKAA